MTEHLEEDSPCPEPNCEGTLIYGEVENCSCHISPPCSSCENQGLECKTCGFETNPIKDRYEDYYREPAPRRPVDRNATTHTRTANQYNSTPFTACCGTAALNTDRCPRCEAKILYHDDGLDSRRRWAKGGCLMCGKPRGDINIAGNCCC